MRQLNTQEVNEVSGAGLFADIGKAIGSAIGSIVDEGTSLGGLKTDAKSPASQLGEGVGNLLELNIVGAISNIGGGIIGIVKFGIDAISQLKSNTTSTEA